MLNKFFQNTRKPQGFLGRLMLRSMNTGHAQLAGWGLSHVSISGYRHIVDVGCGGGANIAKMLKEAPGSTVDGIDYSQQSVAVSQALNKNALGTRCTVRQGDVSRLPYPDASVDLVTAFETIYFWPSIDENFQEIRRILRRGGMFLICCEFDDADDTTWTSRIDGMTIYRGEDLQRRLSSAGFQDIALYRKKEWICLTAIA